MKSALFLGLAVVGLGCGGSPPPPPPPPQATAEPPPPPPPVAPAPTATATAAPATAPAAGGQPAYQDTPAPSEEPKPFKFNQADGRPKGLHAKAAESYWVWHDGGKGRKWHIRTTTATQMHRFHGFIAPEGQVTAVKATRNEWNDRVRLTDKSIGFDFTTTGSEDGFDFESTGTCVRFYLLIDGKSAPNLIKVGKGDAHPPHFYFRLCEG